MSPTRNLLKKTGQMLTNSFSYSLQRVCSSWSASAGGALGRAASALGAGAGGAALGIPPPIEQRARLPLLAAYTAAVAKSVLARQQAHGECRNMACFPLCRTASIFYPLVGIIFPPVNMFYSLISIVCPLVHIFYPPVGMFPLIPHTSLSTGFSHHSRLVSMFYPLISILCPLAGIICPSQYPLPTDPHPLLSRRYPLPTDRYPLPIGRYYLS